MAQLSPQAVQQLLGQFYQPETERPKSIPLWFTEHEGTIQHPEDNWALEPLLDEKDRAAFWSNWDMSRLLDAIEGGKDRTRPWAK